MDYFETLDYLFTQLPMYQRQGAAAYKANLDNTHALMELLEHPEMGLKCIHVAGTNGKGSVCHMLAAVLQAQGYKVGLHTSPHLKDFRERIRINGKVMDQDDVVEFVEKYKVQWSEIQPSFFEITVGMAFWYFQKEEVDIAIIETGMGGRLDSTNVVLPEISVITNIGMDHTQFLGDTIEEIAGEKGGIIKPRIPVVLGEMEQAAEEVLNSIAGSQKSQVFLAKNIDGPTPESDLKGGYQEQNKRTVLMALKVLKSSGWDVSFDAIVEGLAKVSELTGLQGRWHILGESPLIIADGAHNPDGLRFVMDELSEVRTGELHVVLGVVSDKDLDAVLKLFPKDASYYFSQAQIPRAMPADSLRQKAFGYGLKGEQYETIQRAYSAARLYAEKEDTIFVGGSFFTVAEVL